ncbi:MAG: GNAT family N-acetyltransferase, partial [Prevotella sp.]|nr:GNAT family N-acetyltransferase [Prevotella sp.]
MIDIVRYTPSRQQEWNTFVAEAINATFLFRRQYMDYHAQRFADHSLMAYNKGRLVAILPAHEDGEKLCSHNGLTFGGLLTVPRTTTTEVMEVFTQ